MSLSGPLQSRGRFLLKALALLLIMVVAGRSFANRYRIGFDLKKGRCLPNYRLFLVDTKDKLLVPGKIYTFLARGTEPVVAAETWMVKRLVAVPGDLVAISQDDFQITVNGIAVGKGLYWAAQLGSDKGKFCGTKELPADHYWFLGDNETSFDSRYWGSVKSEQIVGRARPLF